MYKGDCGAASAAMDDSFVPLSQSAAFRTSTRDHFVAMMALDGVCIGALTGRVTAEHVDVDRFNGPFHLSTDPEGRVFCSDTFGKKPFPDSPDPPKTHPLGIQRQEDAEPAAFGLTEHPHDDEWVATRVRDGAEHDALLALVFPFLEALRAAYPDKTINYCLWGWCPCRLNGSHALTTEPHRGRLMSTTLNNDAGTRAFRDAVQTAIGAHNVFQLIESTRFAMVARRAIDVLTDRMSWKWM